jgi:hypothetical protein
LTEELLIFKKSTIPFFNVASYPCFERKEPGSFNKKASKASSFMKNPEKVKVKLILAMS